MAKVGLLIGVSEYQKGLNPLPAAVNDVEAMRRVLGNPEMGGFADSDLTVLKNPQPQAIRDAIFRLFANRQKNDLLLFYFSGHGIKDDKGRLYLSSCETHKERGGLVKPSAIAANHLHENINESRSQRQVIILDCCFSGAIAQGMTVKDDGNVDIQAQLGGKGRAILTSSTSTQYSFEQEDSELSIYTRYLVEGIETGAADKDEDGRISVDELHEYARSKVQEAAPAMTPKFYPVEEGHKILLAKSPQDDPQFKYRKEVEKCIRDGEVSIVGRRILQRRKEELGLSTQQTQEIENEVLEPLRIKQQNLQEYKEAFREAVEQETTLSKLTQEELKRLKELLRLRDEDVAPIEQRIIATKQAEYKRQRPKAEQLQKEQQAEHLKPQESEISQKQATTIKSSAHKSSAPKSPPQISRKQFLKWAGLGSTGLAIAVMTREIFKAPPPISVAEPKEIPPSEGGPKAFGLPLWTLEFETVKVDARGEIVERYPNKQAKFFKEDLGNGVSLEMVEIPADSFQMGSPAGEKGRSKNEGPQRNVDVPTFFMGRFEVTQEQYQQVMSNNSSSFKGDKRPVESVSWHNAVEFCTKLSQKTGRKYSLPSEAEWEYACRAGTTTPFHFGETITGELANYRASETFADEPKGEYRQQTTPVGQFPPNAFGLYDMHGNVWEWCADHFHDNYEGAPTDGSAWVKADNNDNHYRVLRGGSWYNVPEDCRSACRFSGNARLDIGIVGLRVWSVAFH